MAHGDPYDRGDSDAYYRRSPTPHKWTFPVDWRHERVEDLTPEEVREYWRGYEENPSGSKDWG